MGAESMGRAIAERRHALGITQAELAARIGVTNKAVSRWECGAGLPDTALLVPLAEALGTDVQTLLCGDSQPDGDVAAEPAAPARPRRTARRVALTVVAVVALLLAAMLLTWMAVRPRI